MTNGVRFLIALFFYGQYCTAQPPVKSYDKILQEVAEARDRFFTAYAHADPVHKDTIVTAARTYLVAKITSDIFPRWYGTPWDFYGTTRTPRQGKIACGYFVTTVLEDAGFNIPRIEWAKSASEVFIRKLSYVNRFSNKPVGEMQNYFLTQGDGLYIAGLDNHVGFVWVHDGTVKFIHSNYYHPDIGVMSEDIRSDNPFYHSRYRAIGKLFSDEMITRWMNNSVYE